MPEITVSPGISEKIANVFGIEQKKKFSRINLNLKLTQITPNVAIKDPTVISISPDGILKVNNRLAEDTQHRVYCNVKIFSIAGQARFLVTADMHQLYETQKNCELHRTFKNMKGTKMIDFIDIFNLRPEDFNLTDIGRFDPKKIKILTKIPKSVMFDCINYFIVS